MLRATIFLALSLLFLAGCKLESDAPLIDQASGEPLLGKRVSMLGVDENGAVQHEASGKVVVTEMNFRNGVYTLPTDKAGEALLISFHTIPEADGLYLVQAAAGAGGETSYVVARRTSDMLYFRPVDLDDTTLAALKGSGIEPKDSGGGHKVTSRKELGEVIRLWTQINLRSLEQTENYAGRLMIEDGAGAGLQARAQAAECLALAGHPEDPSVQRLSKKWRKGKLLNEIDAERALPVCRDAASTTTNPSVLYSLARIHEVRKDYASAERLLPDLMAADFPLAYVLAAEHRAFGNGVPKDPAAARRILSDPAGRGQAMPAYVLGLYELNGTLGQVDRAAARRWFKVAADGGVTEAQYQYGMILNSEPSGQAEAFRNFRDAAKKGHVLSSYQAGYALYFGQGVTSDRKAAYGHLNTAAKGDVAWAQYFVGFMQARGQGTTKNEKSAVGWLEKAHKAEITPATGELGRMVYDGVGTKADKARGKRLLEQAAAKGDKNAKSYLAALKPPPAPKSAAEKYNAPRERAADVNKLANGQPFQLTEQNLPFMTGVASHLLERCKAPSDNIGLRTELALFVSSSSFGSIMGFDYSNPNLGESLGSMGRSQANLIAGGLFAKGLPCGAVANQFATGIAKALRSNARGSDGGLSNFVKSCTPHFDQRRCSCLANVGRQAIPNLHRRHYDRRLIKEIIERNPFLGLQIGIACQIGNY